jgi:NADH-quinone oxidoreductase subunit M
MQKAFFGTPDDGVSTTSHPLPPISIPERIGAMILVGTSVIVGLYPQLLLRVITPALHSPLFDGLWKGSGR